MADPPSNRKKDYSSQVRKKLQSSSRTGQACDRCKLRKIRCDADPGGCAGCRAASEVCETTDRITKKAQRRGHTDLLETENIYLKSKLQEYQQKLIELGVPPSEVQLRSGSFSDEAGGRDGSQQPSTGPGGGLGDDDFKSSLSSGLDASLWQRHMNNTAGNLSPNPAFSMLRGTKLSLFGMNIDLAEFADDPMDMDSPQTFGGFIQFANAAHAKDTAKPPPLPPTFSQAQEYATWFFKFLNAYTPCLDKRQMHQLLIEVYQDPRPGPRPGRTAAQEVMLHMMFSYIKFQYGQRNQQQAMLNEATGHFKYAIGFVVNLLQGRTLEDVQAMAIISLQLRGYPRPGASWIFGQLALGLAVELGMNRSAETLPPAERQAMDHGTVERRKRVFWALYGLVAGISIRLGRPLPLHLADIDIEFPNPVHDYLDGEQSSLNESQKCSFRIGICITKLLALFSDLYSTLYTLTKPPLSEHARLVARFKSDLETWRADKPADIADSTRADNEFQMYAMYLELYDAEFRFLLYHPLLHPPNQPDSYKRTIDSCQDSIKEAQQLLLRIREAKCLDVPWHTTTLLLGMTFTELWIEDQRSAEISEAMFTQVQSNMRIWLDLFGTVGTMLGSGTRLQTSIAQIISKVMETLKANIDARANPPMAGQAMPHTPVAPSNPYGLGNMSKVEPQSAYAAQNMQRLGNAGHTYPAAGTAQAQYPAYDTSGGQAAYSSTQLPYNPAPYGASSTAKQPLGSMASYSTPDGVTYYAPHHGGSSAATPATDWMRFGQQNLNPLGQSQEYITSATANTLMSMGGRNPSVVQSSQAPSLNAAEDGTAQWPMSMYQIGQHYGGNAPG